MNQKKAGLGMNIEANHNQTDSEYVRFIRELNENGIGVNKILEGGDQIGIEMSQFTHPNLDIIDEIIRRASFNAGLEKPVKTDLRIADLKARSEYDDDFERSAKLIYQRQAKKKFKTNTRAVIKTFPGFKRRIL